MSTKTKPLFLCALGIIFLQSQSAQAVLVNKMDPRAGNGLCLPQPKASTEEILRKNKIQISGQVSQVERDALAKVISAMDNIGDGRFSIHRNTHFQFGASSGPSRWTGSKVQINPGGQNLAGVSDKRFGGKNNHAVLVHELGHKVGNTRGLYVEYSRAVNGQCVTSRYSAKKRNEEFAEVFAAYVTNPDLLTKKSAACERARKFMAKLFGESLDKSSSCLTRKQSISVQNVADNRSPEPVQSYTVGRQKSNYSSRQ